MIYFLNRAFQLENFLNSSDGRSLHTCTLSEPDNYMEIVLNSNNVLGFDIHYSKYDNTFN